jgi:protein TonB
MSSTVRRYAPVLVIVAVVSTVMVALGRLVWTGMHAVTKPDRKVVQQVQIIRPPPPPDIKEEPPPDVKDEVKLPEPEETPDTPDNQPAAGDQLGLDAEGGAGGDAFGLLGRKGGRDLLAGAGTDRFSWYANILKSTLVERLSENRNIRRSRYSVTVRLWVKADGRVERVNIDSGTGDKDLDRKIEAAFAALGRVPEAPPADLPQPVRLRLVNRI